MALTSNQRNTAVLLGSSGGLALLAAGWFLLLGLHPESIDLWLRLTARIAFILLLVVFVARPLQQLFSTPGTAKLLRNRRLVGIAFAGVHLLHFGLLVVKHYVVTDFNLAELVNPFAVLVYGVILAMLVTSWNTPARAIGSKAWKVLHKTGLYALFVAFTQTQLPYPGQGWEDVNWWFIAVIATALVIRLTAFFARRSKAQQQ